MIPWIRKISGHLLWLLGWVAIISVIAAAHVVRIRITLWFFRE